MTNLITRFVDNAGLAAVFFLMFIESCGIPAPSEVTMPLAGVFAAQGHLNLGGAIVVATLANLCGSLLAYALARRWGEPLLLGPGRRVGISQSHLDLADRWFQRWGLYAVFFGRLLPVVRTYISFPAGLARVRTVPFAVLTAVGALPWCAALAYAGYKLGSDDTKVSDPISKLAIVLAVVVAGIVVWWFMRGRHGRSAPTAPE